MEECYAIGQAYRWKEIKTYKNKLGQGYANFPNSENKGKTKKKEIKIYKYIYRWSIKIFHTL